MRDSFEVPCYSFSDVIVPQEPQVDLPTLVLVHPLRLLGRARITDHREIQNPASDWREWADSSDLLAELVCARHPRTLNIVEFEACNVRVGATTLNRIGLKTSSWVSPVIPRYFLCDRLRCSGSKGS